MRDIKTQNNRATAFLLRNITLLILLALAVYSILFVPNFASLSNAQSIASQASYLILVAIGMTFVILNGGIDFSVVAVINLGSVVGAMIMSEKDGLLSHSGAGFLVAILVMLLIGVAIGLLNGFSVVVLKMPSFIATMAVNLVFSGLAVFLTKSDTITGLPKAFRALGNSQFLGIPVSVFIALAAVLATHYLLSRTVFGRRVYAVGTTPLVARISGTNVKGVILRLFVLSGFFAALSGIVLTAWIGAGKPTVADDMTMDIVSAVVIGGTSTFGGSGTITGTVVGALLITVMSSSLSLMGLNWYTISTIKGFILLAVALIDAAKRIAK